MQQPTAVTAGGPTGPAYGHFSTRLTSGSHQRGGGHLYGCLTYLKRGTSVCGNGLRLPLDRVDDAVLRTLAGDVLRPAVVMAIVDGVLAELSPRALTRRRDRERDELPEIEREIGNLAKAIAAGGQLEPLLAELQARQSRRDELLNLIAVHEVEPGYVRHFDRKTIEAKVHEHVKAWRTLLTKHVQDGRQLLREVLRRTAQVHA